MIGRFIAQKCWRSFKFRAILVAPAIWTNFWIFLLVYLSLLHEKCSYNQEKRWKWKWHIWRTLQYQKNSYTNALIFHFGLKKINSHLVNFYEFADNTSLLDQYYSYNPAKQCEQTKTCCTFRIFKNEDLQEFSCFDF